MTAEHIHSGASQVDDTDVAQAMAVYDVLNTDEQREVFRTVYRAVAAYRHTSDIDHLKKLADSVEGMVVHETNHPGVREKIRNVPKTARAAGGVVDTAEVIRRLRG
ncbi:hypothetical protein GCM10027176_16860 [Actinoallomurus bryophytorum]|uniref:Uncharacterized protein n=1 Tax=Actinoallomurus bryophytorum TaxID=1490222 RepID=A0A543CLP4_9ACTN|nr:hypothetical protein [Actinoallomurus bryophytorum]TQL98022.1 hypothetical protein FB559_3636 [Actinoallomurus bryophytorum]